MNKTDQDKIKLAELLTKLLHRSMSRPNTTLGWKPYSSTYNFIEELEKIGVDFSNVKLEL